MHPDPSPYLTEADVSARLAVSRPTLYRWRRAGIGPSWSRLGPRRVGYPSDALEAWLKANDRAPAVA